MVSIKKRFTNDLYVHTAGCGKTSIILALVGEEFPLYVSVLALTMRVRSDGN